ncbi:MAG: rod shape-determining protein RodA [Acidobacteriota bacterium]|nr:rod shape-determining protein RodA [Acidobacteriota bacterium]
MKGTTGRVSTLAVLPEEGLRLRQLANVRWGLLVAAFLLASIGLATIHSASSELPVDYLPRQLVRIALGLLAFVVVFTLDYQVLMKFSVPIYAVSLSMLLLVLFVGSEAGGARSWLKVGATQLQPSDLAKVATALLVARYLATANRRYLTVRQILTAACIVAVPAALVAMERDLGGAAMFLPMLAGMVLLAGVRWRVLVALIVAAAIVSAGLWSFAMLDYQRERVKTFLSPGSDPLDAGYQLQQSKIAVGSGQLTGRGYMQGTQSQLRFLPARHTDFVFAVLAEEWGFVGVATVMVLFTVYLLNGITVAMRARDRAAILLVVGLLSLLGFHVVYNTAMVVGLVPITGIPLPFLSYGGSFILANFIATGLILGADYRRYVNR